MRLTWRQLQAAIANLTNEQLDMPVNICVNLTHCGQICYIEDTLQIFASNQPYLQVEAEE